MTLVMLKWRVARPMFVGMIGVSLMAGPMLALGVSPTLVLLVPLAFLAGCGQEVFGIGWSTALHEHIPNDVLSRVNSYDALGSFVAIPLGQLTIAPLAQVFDPTDVMAVSAIAYLAISLLTLLSRSVRNLRRGPIHPTDEPRMDTATLDEAPTSA
jgi:hypothetical protein